MAKMQNVNFGSINDFLDYLPDNERKIVEVLRHIVKDSIPNGKEKLSYNVPYFSRHYRICFIWPASVPWGNVMLDGVQLGFCYGSQLQDEDNYLESGTRKMVRSKTFKSIQEIDEDLIRSYIYEAVEIDELMKKEKLSKK